jgi:hypothetical protein
MRRRFALLVASALAGALAASPPALAGRLVATGHDADLHCSGGAPQCKYFGTVVTWVRAGAPNPALPVLVFDKGSNQVSSALDAALGAGAVPRVVVDPSAPAFGTTPIDVGRFSAIVVASDSSCGGCDLNPTGTPMDSDAIFGRAGEIARFFNAGGGIVALAGANHGGALGSDNSYYRFVPLPLGGAPVSPPFTLTDVGRAIGLTDDPSSVKSPINCCATHNSFSLPPAGSALRVAETDSKSLAETLVAEGSISGGGIVTKPPAGGGAPAGTLPTPFGRTGAIGIPSSKRCLSRRSFRIHIRERNGVRYTEAIVFVNRKRVGVIKRRRFSAGVNLRGLPFGTFRVQITVIATDGRIINGKRTYHTCRKRGPAHGAPRL